MGLRLSWIQIWLEVHPQSTSSCKALVVLDADRGTLAHGENPHSLPVCPQALLSLDSNGRQVLPPDTKTDLSRAYCLALAAAPLLDTSRLGERSLTSRELVRLLVRACAGMSYCMPGRRLSCDMSPAC